MHGDVFVEKTLVAPLYRRRSLVSISFLRRITTQPNVGEVLHRFGTGQARGQSAVQADIDTAQSDACPELGQIHLPTGRIDPKPFNSSSQRKNSLSAGAATSTEHFVTSLSDDVIPIRVPNAELVFFDAAAQTTPSLVGEIFQIQYAHRPLEADVQFADVAFRQRLRRRHRMASTPDAIQVKISAMLAVSPITDAQEQRYKTTSTKRLSSLAVTPTSEALSAKSWSIFSH